MNCPNCGATTNTSQGERFCGGCGVELIPQSNQVNQMNNQQAFPQQDPNQMQNNMNGAVMANQNMQQQQPMTPDQSFANNQINPNQNMNNQQGFQQQQMQPQMQQMNNNQNYQMPNNMNQNFGGQVDPNKIQWGWVILGGFIPIVGWILWGVWKDKKPATAKACGIAGFIGFGLNLILLI